MTQDLRSSGRPTPRRDLSPQYGQGFTRPEIPHSPSPSQQNPQTALGQVAELTRGRRDLPRSLASFEEWAYAHTAVLRGTIRADIAGHPARYRLTDPPVDEQLHQLGAVAANDWRYP